MRKHTVELLERRQLLAVTLNNGLAASDPNYYEVTLGRGGEPSTIMWENRNVMFEYSALLDLGANNAVGTAQVVQLSSFGTDAVPGSAPGTAVSTVTLVLDDTTTTDPTDNPVITVAVTSTVPAGETRLVTSYSFSSVGYNLTNAHFFQYWDCVSGDVTSDFVKIRGSIATGNLQLRTYNTDSYNYSILQDDVKTPNAVLTGFGVGEYPIYKPVITAGGYVAPATGDIRIPAATFTGLGAGYGPVPFAVPVLQYGFTSANSGTVNTSLTQAPAVIAPQMEVNWLTGTVEVPIPDGSTNRDPMIGVDFGVWSNVRFFTIRNSGRGDLQLMGNPVIQITGPNADAFRVVRVPLTHLQGGGMTIFAIEYLPAQGGTQTATISINSNDLEVTPYTFNVFGGSGLGIAPDVYENDGANFSDSDANWAAEFAQIKASARAISTQDAMQAHSIHAVTDADWVRFTLENTSNTIIETFAPVGDTRLYLYDSDGQRIAFDDNSGPGNSARIGNNDPDAASAHVLAPGTYYVRVDEAGNNALVPFYALYVRTDADAANPPVYTDADGKLWVWGTTQDDAISVDVYQSSLRVVRNNNMWFFPLSEVTGVEVRSGWGNDTVYVGPGVVATTVLGGLGDDAITYASNSNAWIAGGVGDDYIIGGAGNDHINAKDGNDTIDGGAGDDRLQGGWGDDLIHGSAGNDDIMANYGNDSVYGGTGNDSIDGYYGDDSLFGEEGNDVIIGGMGRDSIDGGAGTNQLTSWQDYDVDTVVSASSLDVLYVDNDPSSVLDVVLHV